MKAIALIVLMAAIFCCNAQSLVFTELKARNGLPNFFSKTKKGDSVTIAYLGGSITATDGYRVQSTRLFNEQFKWKVRGVNAGLGGTGSDLGAFRLYNDALQYDPDLLFVEFAVNDFDKDSVTIARAMEGIVRQTKKHNPQTDICFIYTVSRNMFPELPQGKLATSTRTMESIADYYGIPSINMAATVIELLHQDKLIYETEATTDPKGRIIFSKDGVHPYMAGHQLYTEAIDRSFRIMLKSKGRKTEKLPTPIREDNYEAAKYYSVESFPRSAGFKMMDENHRLSHFLQSYDNLIYTNDPSDSLVIQFKGTSIGFEDIIGPTSCAFSVSIDGGEPMRIPRFDFWCAGHRRSFFMMDGLEDARHRVVVRVDGTPFDKFAIVDPQQVKDSAEYSNYFLYIGKVLLIGDTLASPASELRKELGDKLLGTYRTIVGNREYTYNRTPRFELKFNEDGTISDVTPRLSVQHGRTTWEGKNVFYMIGYMIFSDNYGADYKNFQNIYLPDGIYTIRQFVCDPAVAPDLKTFTAKIDGWHKNINGRNSSLSEIFLSIKTIGDGDSKAAKSIAPDWLKVSRHLRYQDYAEEKDWSPYNKFVGIVYQNRGTSADDYQRLGLHTEYLPDTPGGQKNTWYTPSWHTSMFIPDKDLYDHGRQWIQMASHSPRFVLTDQIHEKVFGDDSDIYGRLSLFYKGAYEELLSKNPSIRSKRETGLYGTYNYDDFTGAVTPEMIFEPKERYIESLTSHAHIVWDKWKHQWKSDTAEYFSRGLINYRNINHMMYLYNDRHYLPYRLLYINERVKIATKTYRGEELESNWLVFTWPAIQNMVMDEQGYPGIEYFSTGEIIPFENGEIISQQNYEIPAPWDEWLNMGFWSTLVSNGFVMWIAPKLRFGMDSTKLNWWSDQPVFWTPRGGERESYIPGKNGAPLNDENGMRCRLWASPQDAALAGSEAVWAIRNRIASLSHASYRSSRGKFRAVPGDNGLHLNGFGPLNRGQYVLKDAFDQQKGIALVGKGNEGGVVIYYNGFLGQHEYEDSVTVEVRGGKPVKLGRVYGRQTVVKTFE